MHTSLVRGFSLAVGAVALAACTENNPKQTTNPPVTAPRNEPAPIVPVVPADPSLLHRFSFTDAKDAVGKVNVVLKGTAKFQGGKAVFDSSGMTSGDANLPYVDFSGPILPTTGNGSIAIWFTCAPVTTNGHGPRLLDIGDSSGGVGNAFLYFAPHFSNSGNFRAKISATDSASGTALEAPQLDDNKPHLVIIALDGATMHVFVDGKEPTAAVNVSNNTLASVKQVHNWLGRSGFDQDEGLSLQIDEVRTYNRALTAADAAALQTTGPDKLPRNP